MEKLIKQMAATQQDVDKFFGSKETMKEIVLQIVSSVADQFKRIYRESFEDSGKSGDAPAMCLLPVLGMDVNHEEYKVLHVMSVDISDCMSGEIMKQLIPLKVATRFYEVMHLMGNEVSLRPDIPKFTMGSKFFGTMLASESYMLQVDKNDTEAVNSVLNNQTRISENPNRQECVIFNVESNVYNATISLPVEFEESGLKTLGKPKIVVENFTDAAEARLEGAMSNLFNRSLDMIPLLIKEAEAN